MVLNDFYESVNTKVQKFLYPRRFKTKRRNTTYKLDIGNQSVFLCVGQYDNGDVGEIFIDLHKEGSTMRAIFNCLAIAVSLGLQYGVPLKTYIHFFSYTNFEPNGIVIGFDKVKNCTSIVDAIFRILAIQYLNMTEYEDKKLRSTDTNNDPSISIQDKYNKDE